MPAASIPYRRPIAPCLATLAVLTGALTAAVIAGGCSTVPAPPPSATTPAGSIQGHATVHDTASRAGLVAKAQLALPAAATGGSAFVGAWRDRPATTPGTRLPVVLFLHGSSGLGLKAIGEWQRWLAGLGVASVAPDSFALPDRLTYTSPIDRATYERIHALRASEIGPMLDALRATPWVDPARIVLAGTSEGSVAVARHPGDGFAGRLIYTWSCEDNYFVDGARTVPAPALPVLNVISSTDPYFSSSNGWLDRPHAQGHCGAALAAHPRATIVLIPGAPHTLLNLPAARDATAAFVRDVLRP
jgi:dienelactone hydrolase